MQVCRKLTSGRWSGTWTLIPEEYTEVIELAFHEGRIWGFGRDGNGNFEYSGEYDDRVGISLLKTYTSRNSEDVITRRIYKGMWDGRRLSGGWFNEQNIWVAGSFHMWPGRGREPRYLFPGPEFTWETLLGD